MLRTKSILAPLEQETDGLRISVMSRHTLNDGKTLDPRIYYGIYDLHLPELAPPGFMVCSWYGQRITWETFEDMYKTYLQIKKEQVHKLAQRATKERLTLLCIEKEPTNCHRRLLAEECKLYVPELELYLA